MRPIPVGAKGSFAMVVSDEHLANRFKDATLPPVLATPVDMSLKVVEHRFGEQVARATARHMEYPYPDTDGRRIQFSALPANAR